MMSSVKSFIFKGSKWKPELFCLKFFRLFLDRLLNKDEGKKRSSGFVVDLGQSYRSACACMTRISNPV